MTNRKIQLQFLVILLVGTLILTFLIFQSFIAPLALAIVFSVVLQPLYRLIMRKIWHKPSFASLATVVISIICLIVPFSLLGFQVIQEARGLYGTLAYGNNGGNELVASIQKVGSDLEPLVPGSYKASVTFSSNIETYMKQGLSWIVDHAGTALTGASALFLNITVFIVALYYLLKDGYKLKEAIVDLSPLENTIDEKIFGRLSSAVSSVITGNLIIALLQGVVAATGLTIFGVPNSILWGSVAAIASLVPGFGTLLVTGPAILYLFFTGHTFSAIGLILWGSLVVGLIDNLVGPKLIGRGTRLHPLLVLLSVLGGISFFGPVGIFIGPLVLNLLLAFIEIYTLLTSHTSSEIR
jgi:predicted PurR-regulated permease PerM